MKDMTMNEPHETLPAVEAPPVADVTKVPVALFALSAGIIITNLFAPQTIAGLMAADFQLGAKLGGLMAMIPLLGYAAGLFFLVPLADLMENRRLVLRMLACAAVAAAGTCLAPTITALFASLFVLGAACSAIQVLVPAAAAMTTAAERGRVIGDIMSGLLVGILLSRSIASTLAGMWGWKAFYAASAAATTLLTLLLAIKLPRRAPQSGSSYGRLVGSLWQLFTSEPILRGRSISAAIVMMAFNFFWTTVVYVLEGAPFKLGQFGVAAFALAGAGASIVTPLVGRWADRGLGAKVTSAAHLVLMAGFGLAALSVPMAVPSHVRLAGLALSAVLLDVGVLGEQTVGRYLINQIRPEARGRMNGIFVGVFFLGGALGSALSGILWSSGGWNAVCAGGALLGLLAFLTRRPGDSEVRN